MSGIRPGTSSARCTTIDRAGALDLVDDQAVLGVQKQQAKYLGSVMAHGNTQVVDQSG